VEPGAAGAEQVAALEGRGAGIRYAEGDAGAVRLQHAERRAQGRAAERVDDQPIGAVRPGGAEVAVEDDAPAAPCRDRLAVFGPAHMTPHQRAGGRGELAGEVPDTARRAIDQHLAAEQEAA